MIEIRKAESDRDYNTGAELFKEYAAYIGIDLEFQNFAREVEDLRSQYSAPEGALLIVSGAESTALGCVGIRKLEDNICELKRMYLKPETRGQGLGLELMNKALRTGRKLKYEKMRLDTLANMEAAIALYRKAGFYEIAPYRYNPMEDTVYMEILLR
ncbi:GNAT family N-acetyltransferase [Sinomicrobium sp. M5D2P17]